jgi:hypothetical protein
VLAFQHTRSYWPLFVVLIPNRHVPSLLSRTAEDLPLLSELVTAVSLWPEDPSRSTAPAVCSQT